MFCTQPVSEKIGFAKHYSKFFEVKYFPSGICRFYRTVRLLCIHENTFLIALHYAKYLDDESVSVLLDFFRRRRENLAGRRMRLYFMAADAFRSPPPPPPPPPLPVAPDASRGRAI
jgi:hypothetical protein